MTIKAFVAEWRKDGHLDKNLNRLYEAVYDLPNGSLEQVMLHDFINQLKEVCGHAERELDSDILVARVIKENLPKS